MTEPAFVLGLDLGQTTDYSALAVGEIVPGSPFHLLIRHLDRLQKQTPYPTQVSMVGDTVGKVIERGRTLLAIDQTGVGRPVVDMFRIAGLKVPIWPITITASGQARRDPVSYDWHVPKKDLIGALLSLAHSGRLGISNQIPALMQATIKEELKNFRMKFTAASNITFESWREGDHDDLVLAVAMVAWSAQRWANPGGLQ